MKLSRVLWLGMCVCAFIWLTAARGGSAGCLGGYEYVECKEGEERACPGPAAVGICTPGKQSCTEAGVWGECQGRVTAEESEVCGNSKDDDCNGQVDDGC